MEIYEQIRSLLSDKENFQVKNGKVLMKDMFGDFCERKVNSKGQVDLKWGVFLWADVEAAISGKVAEPEKVNPLPISQDELTQYAPLPKDYVTTKDIVKALLPEKAIRVKKEKKPAKLTKSAKEKRAALRNAEIQIIRKMVTQGKKPSEIAKAVGAPLHAVMYIVKQIKAGKKLKYE